MVGLFLFNSAVYSITSLLYEHENEILTELCCVNKKQDDACRAKCFLDKTKESDKKDKTVRIKNTVVYFEQIESSIQSAILKKTEFKHTFFYSDELTHLFLDGLERPPSLPV